jgi:hypothetical protein
VHNARTRPSGLTSISFLTRAAARASTMPGIRAQIPDDKTASRGAANTGGRPRRTPASTREEPSDEGNSIADVSGTFAREICEDAAGPAVAATYEAQLADRVDGLLPDLSADERLELLGVMDPNDMSTSLGGSPRCTRPVLPAPEPGPQGRQGPGQLGPDRGRHRDDGQGRPGRLRRMGRRPAPAARGNRPVRPGRQAVRRGAAADVLTAAADAVDSPELARAADSFSRAAPGTWGRIPVPSPARAGLRTAAYLLAACDPGRTRRRISRIALTTALGGLAAAVAEMRHEQGRLLQAAAARQAAAGLAAALADGPGPAEVPTPALRDSAQVRLSVRAFTRLGGRPH